MCSTEHLVVTLNDSDCFMYLLYFLTIILQCVLSTYKKKFAVKQRAVTRGSSLTHLEFTESLDCIILSLLDLISCCLVQWHALWACSLGAVGYTT